MLTQAVTQLRKAFANDDDNGQAYIETIAKSGYRLLVPVQALDDFEPVAEVDALAIADVMPSPDGAGMIPALAVPAAASRRRGWRQLRRQLLWVLGVMMLAALLVMATLLLRRGPEPSSPVDAAVENGVRVIGSPQRPYRLITATSGFEPIPHFAGRLPGCLRRRQRGWRRRWCDQGADLGQCAGPAAGAAAEGGQ